jgi:hypothetical protein
LAYYESCANIGLYRDVGMDYDQDKVDEMVLALLYLTIWEEDVWGARAWKSHAWDALDRLHTKGTSRTEDQGKVGGAERGGSEAGVGTLRAALRAQGLSGCVPRGCTLHELYGLKSVLTT